MATKLIFWDFDGVIGNTFDVCLRINQMSDPFLTAEEYSRRFEGNINHAKAERESRQKIDFFTEYEKVILEAPLIEGIEPILHTLASSYDMVIVSSTITPLIEKYLRHYGLLAFFKEILGNDVATSKSEKFLLGMEKYHSSPKDAVLVTDTLGDIVEANVVELPSIAVTWGFQAKETLLRGKPAVLLDSPDGLLSAIQKILSG